MKTEQTVFWSGQFGDAYIDRNVEFDMGLAHDAWGEMFRKVDRNAITSVLECGSNIGRNLAALRRELPGAAMSLIEVNKIAFDQAVKNVSPAQASHSSILGADLPLNSFDLVFTVGVLIHIAPYDLYRNMEKMIAHSSKYVLFAEYFSRTLDMKIYRGAMNKLFKMDFGGFCMDNFPVKLVDYGFLWGRKYDAAGFDDMTWWLFEKNNV